MRKSFLTKEYSIEGIAGTFNMKEQRAFFSSKILEIEDVMYIGNNNINWTESQDKTQGIRLEDVNGSFNTFQVKKDSHTLRISPQQTDQEKREFTKWEMNFNVRDMITKYLFSQLKANRTFAGIDNSKTLNLSVDSAINQYIIDNVYPRIKFYNIVLYIQYYRIGEPQGFLDANNNPVIALQYDIQFRENLISPPSMGGETTEQYTKRVNDFKNSITVKNFQLTTDPNENVASVIYKQTKSSLNYKFDYYFDVIWKKA
jgi:hypothetical protein